MFASRSRRAAPLQHSLSPSTVSDHLQQQLVQSAFTAAPLTTEACSKAQPGIQLARTGSAASPNAASASTADTSTAAMSQSDKLAQLAGMASARDSIPLTAELKLAGSTAVLSGSHDSGTLLPSHSWLIGNSSDVLVQSQEKVGRGAANVQGLKGDSMTKVHAARGLSGQGVWGTSPAGSRAAPLGHQPLQPDGLIKAQHSKSSSLAAARGPSCSSGPAAKSNWFAGKTGPTMSKLLSALSFKSVRKAEKQTGAKTSQTTAANEPHLAGMGKQEQAVDTQKGGSSGLRLAHGIHNGKSKFGSWLGLAAQ